MKEELKSHGQWYFLLISLVIFALSVLVKPSLFKSTLTTFRDTLLRVIPSLIIVFFLLFLFNIFSNNKLFVRHLKENRGIKTWLISIIGGIISSGPIYMWYPLLGELQKKGVKNGIIATFLYSRAIKIPLMPIIITYFGLKFTLILTFVMIVFSTIQGVLVDYLMRTKI